MRLARDDCGSGLPVLLVHGFPTSRRLWKDVVPALAAAGFRAIAPDLAGYGESPDAGDVGMESQARWLLEMLDELGLAQVSVVAHDVGTAAAQILAVREPKRVRRLVLIDGVHETEWAMSGVSSIVGWDPAQAARLQPVLARKLRAIRELLEPYAGETGGNRLIHAARCLEPRQTAGMTARLRATGIPVQVIWGAEDAWLPLETIGRPLAAELGTGVKVLPGGHFLPFENPSAVARELIE
ncbi:MAG: alpha/beta fold hydrolase [Myxococcales bacterium]|nr:alpha/beta hydrolase [Myxococcales bacterium]